MSWISARIAALSIVVPMIHAAASCWDEASPIARELRVIANTFARESKLLRARRVEESK